MEPEALSIFREAYNIDFPTLPQTHAKADLHGGRLNKLKDFLIESGVTSTSPLRRVLCRSVDRETT
jgi:hypothetical protein